MRDMSTMLISMGFQLVASPPHDAAAGRGAPVHFAPLFSYNIPYALTGRLAGRRRRRRVEKVTASHSRYALARSR